MSDAVQAEEVTAEQVAAMIRASQADSVGKSLAKLMTDGELAYVFSKPAPSRDSEEWLDYAAEVTSLLGQEDTRVALLVNQVIALRHVFGHRARKRMVNQATGEVYYLDIPRIVLIDDEGIQYACAAEGVADSLAVIMQLFGQPSTWPKPVNVIVRDVPIEGGQRSTLKLEVWNGKDELVRRPTSKKK